MSLGCLWSAEDVKERHDIRLSSEELRLLPFEKFQLFEIIAMNVFKLPFTFRLHRIRILIVTTTFVCAMVIFLPLFRKSSIPSTSAHHPSFKKTLRFKYVSHVGNRSVACRLAQLDPFHESILQFIEDLGKLQCEGKSFSSFDNNVLRVEGEGIVSAQYRIIGRPPGDDFNILRSEPVPIPNIADNSAEKAVQYEQHSRGTISSVSCHGFNIILISFCMGGCSFSR